MTCCSGAFQRVRRIGNNAGNPKGNPMKDRITIKGLTFKVETEHDSDMRAPWDENEGYGPVSEWRHDRRKRAGERVLSQGRGSYRFYDMAEAMKIAKRDGWGLSDEKRAKLATKMGRAPTRAEVIAESVEQDFDYLRRWGNDDWWWMGVVVTLLDTEGNETLQQESLWGLDSDSEDYAEECAQDLAQRIADAIGRKKIITEGARRIWVRA